jgi:hypothetical protein
MYVYVQRDRRLTRNKLLIHSSLTTKIMIAIMISRGMIFEFKYLVEFEFIFEKVLGSESADQVVAFQEKNRVRKSCASVALSN